MGIEVKRHMARCFMHDDTHPSLSFFGENRKMWKCFVCGKSGNAIGLVKEYCSMGFVEACNWLCQEYHIQNHLSFKPRKRYRRDIIKPVKPKAEEKDSNSPDPEVMEWVISHAGLSEQAKEFLFDERRLSPGVIESLQIGSISSPQKLLGLLFGQFGQERVLTSGFAVKVNDVVYPSLRYPCLLYPFRDVDGHLFTIQARYFNQKQRFQFLKGSTSSIFNLPVIKGMRPGEDLHISEGVSDCLALLSSGHKAVAIPSATTLPRDQVRLISPFRLIMHPDNDQAGQKGFFELRKMLISMSSYIDMEEIPKGFKDFGAYYISLHK